MRLQRRGKYKRESDRPYSDTKVLPGAQSHPFWTATQSWTVNIHSLVNAPDGLKSDIACNDLVNDLVYITTMAQVGVHEAKTHLSRLLRRVAAGEVIVIAKGGTPLARLVPIHSRVRRDLGRDSGAVVVHEDFDAPLPEDHGQAPGP